MPMDKLLLRNTATKYNSKLLLQTTTTDYGGQVGPDKNNANRQTITTNYKLLLQIIITNGKITF